MFSLTTFATYAQSLEDGSGGKKLIRTNCVVASTGEVVGYANDCGTGSGNCIDTTCN